jgi:hypothetical protein
VATSGTYYISPTGSDANAGTAGAPFTTFSKAWSVLKPGNTLIVKNGSYNQNIIPPQGFAGTASNPITIKAESDGGALVNGSAQLVTNSYLVFEGLKMKSSAGESVFDISNRNEKSSPSLATASHHITLRRMGLECPLSGNTVNDGSCVGISSGAHDNLIEDSWIWGGGRYSLLLYGRDGGGGTTVTGADRNTLRRLILRVGPNVSGGGQPQAALALYYASNNTIENVLALDGIASSDSSNSAFYITSHATPPNVSGNKFYGVIALNTQGTAGSKPTGFYLDVDNGGVSSNTEVHNSVFWNSGEAGLAVYNSLPANNQNMIINHVTSGKNGGSGYENYTNSVSIRSSLFLENKGYGLRNGTSGSTLENYNIIYGNTGSARSNVTVGANSLSVNPNLRYITRTEPSSGGKGTGEGGSDIGATVLYRYEDGSLTSSNLWPWPNEVRIKSEMCTGIYATRGFCASSSLTQYVWEAAGNSMPTDVTGNTTATTPTTAQSLATVPQTTTSPTPVTTTTQTTTIVFTRDLTVNDVGDDVKALQQFLNQQGFTIATTGAGSPGNETTTFGTLTQTALSKFQTTYGISPSTGYFGPVTCKKVMTINPPVSCTMAGI